MRHTYVNVWYAQKEIKLTVAPLVNRLEMRTSHVAILIITPAHVKDRWLRDQSGNIMLWDDHCAQSYEMAAMLRQNDVTCQAVEVVLETKHPINVFVETEAKSLEKKEKEGG